MFTTGRVPSNHHDGISFSAWNEISDQASDPFPSETSEQNDILKVYAAILNVNEAYVSRKQNDPKTMPDLQNSNCQYQTRCVKALG